MTPLISIVYYSYIAIWVLSIMDLWITSVHSSNIAVSPNLAKLTADHYINLDDDYAIKQLAIIVDALENLSILDSSKQNCYMVDKITQHSKQIDQQRWRVGVEFYVSVIESSVLHSFNSINGSEQTGSAYHTGNNSLSAQDNVTSPCHYVTASKVVDNDTSLAQDGNGSAVHETGRGRKKDKDWKEKLSHTQIMVISTCSAVIGVFFIIAMIMRIRNYLKRKSNQERDRAAQFTGSMALRSSSQSPARTESIASKYGCPDSKSSLSSQSHVNGALPNSHFCQPQGHAGNHLKPHAPIGNQSRPDNKPLLVITSASAPSSPHTHQTKPATISATKQKVTQSPSAPLGECSRDKDYLTINRSHSMNKTKTTNSAALRGTPNKRMRPRQRNVDIHFGEYYRDDKSSDSSFGEMTPLSPRHACAHISKNQKKRKDSSTSNQSGYESSVSSNFTDCSVSTKTTPIENKDCLNIFSPIENNASKKSMFTEDVECDNDDDDVFDVNAIKSLLPDPLSSALAPTGSHREKTLSSSSSHGGRKSVSFSLDVKTDEIETPSTEDMESAVEADQMLHNAEYPSETENSLLLRPEFLGMKPTYV